MNIVNIRYVERKKVPPTAQTCLGCGRRSTKRLEIFYQEREGGKLEKFTLCSQIPYARDIWEEVRREKMAKGIPQTGTYEDEYPQCWQKILWDDRCEVVLRGAGVCRVRDMYLKCEVCEAMMSVKRGGYVSDNGVRTVTDGKSVICFECLSRRLERMVSEKQVG